MKKIIATALCCLLLTGCGGNGTDATGAPTTEPPTTAPVETTVPETTGTPMIKFTLYTPDENAEGFYETELILEHLDAHAILSELITEGVLNEDILINDIQQEGTQLNLDFNDAFLAQLNTYGTAGERMMIGAVVNTFLSAYEAETVYITIDGEILESSHVVYDFPLEFVE